MPKILDVIKTQQGQVFLLLDEMPRRVYERTGNMLVSSHEGFFDFMKIVPEQVARFLPGRTFVPLGTDGMGRSDTREALRDYFEVDAGHVVVAVLSAMVADGKASADEVQAAIARHGIDPESHDPLHV